MKTLVILATLLIVGAEFTSAQPAYTKGRRIRPRDAKPIAELCTGGRKYVCNEDTCPKGLVLCLGPAGQGIDFSCSGSKPYCGIEDGVAKCVGDEPSSCPADENTAGDNVCLTSGAFPDPADCKKYFVCTDDGSGGYFLDGYECDDQYVFSPIGELTQDYCRFTRNRYCVTANCGSSSSGKLLSYPGYSRNQYGVNCRGTGKQPIPFKCPRDTPADLTSFPVECKPRCTSARKYAYPPDDTKYYECVRTAFGGYDLKVKSCFRNYYFDANRRICIINPTPATPTTTVATTAADTTAADTTAADTTAADTTAADTTAAGGDTTTGGNTSGETTLPDSTTAEGDSTTVEGDSTTAEGDSTTAEGDSTTAEGDSTTVEGDSTTEANPST